MMGNGPESWARVRRGKVQARWEFRSAGCWKGPCQSEVFLGQTRDHQHPHDQKFAPEIVKVPAKIWSTEHHQNSIRTPSELHQNSIRNPETKFVTENHRKPKLNRTPSEPHQNSIRTPSELHQNSIRPPKKNKSNFKNKKRQQNFIRTPSEPHQNSIRTPSEPPPKKSNFENKINRTPSEPHQNPIRTPSECHHHLEY